VKVTRDRAPPSSGSTVMPALGRIGPSTRTPTTSRCHSANREGSVL
jgi:hypothetical protein